MTRSDQAYRITDRMRWSGSFGAWGRREKVLSSLTALFVALGVVAALLSKTLAGVVGAGAALFGILTVVIVFVRVHLEKRREQAEKLRLTRVPIAGIGSVKPTDVGVDQAAETILNGEDLPEYLPRKVDKELLGALEAGLNGNGRWIVLVVGPPKVGKSRTLFEALRRCSAMTDGRELEFVAPVDGDAAKSLLAQTQARAPKGERCVLWLDDLEPFLAQGLTFQALREWQEGSPRRIVVATYGGKGGAVVQSAEKIRPVTIYDEVLQHATEVRMRATTRSELKPLRSKVERSVLQLVERYGLAAYLVAAPALQRKLSTGRGAPEEPACPEGVAIVQAAIDWARAGRSDPVSEDTLRRLWPHYLPDSVRPTDAAFQTGVEWGLRPVAGNIGLLRYLQGYRAYDYLVGLAEDQSDGSPPDQAIWASAIEHVSDLQALEVGRRAGVHDRHEDALAAYGRAAQSSDGRVALVGRFNEGVTLSEMGRQEEATKVIRDVIDGIQSADDRDLQALMGLAMLARAYVLMSSERAEEAIEALDLLVKRFDNADSGPSQADESILRDLTTGAALLFQGLAHGSQHRSEEAIAAFDAVDERGDSTGGLYTGAFALAAKGHTLALEGEREAAIAVWRDLAQRYRDATDPDVQVMVADALVRMGRQLLVIKQGSEALTAFDEGIEHCKKARTQDALEVLATALVNRGQALASVKRWADAVSTWTTAIDLFSEETDPEIRAWVAVATVRLGDSLMQEGATDAAIAHFDKVLQAADPPRSAVMDTARSAARTYRDQALRQGGRRGGSQ
jgi:tetratricopeptide (TPR) repeat protein